MSPSPLNDAKAAFQAGRLKEAEAHCRTALAANPDHVEALMVLVAVLAQAQRPAEARTTQERVVALSPGNAAERRRLAEFVEKLDGAAAALAHWRAAVALEPGNPRGLNNLAKALTDTGEPAAAVAELLRALALQPRYPIALTNLGRARLKLGDVAGAVEALEAALGLQPNLGEAHLHLALARQRRDLERLADLDSSATDATSLTARGTLRLATGASALALADFDTALAQAPGHLDAHAGRVEALLALGNVAAAVTVTPGSVPGGAEHAGLLAAHARALLATSTPPADVERLARRAIALDPTRAAAHITLGAAHLLGDALLPALQAFEAALALSPIDIAALHGCARVLGQLQRVEEALQAYTRLLAVAPHVRQAVVDALVYRTLAGQMGDALIACDMLLALDADDANAWRSRAMLLLAVHRPIEALPAFERASALLPDDPSLRIYRFSARLGVCDWQDYAATSAWIADRARAGEDAGAPHALLYHCDDPAVHLAVAKRAAAEEVDNGPAVAPPPLRRRRPGEPLRVGYLSPDLRDHPVGEIMSHVLEHHDPRRVTVYGYALGARDPGHTQRRIAAACAHFRVCHLASDEALVEAIRADGLDIAIDLAGYTSGNRPVLFGRRLAPLQVAFLGHPGPFGSRVMDYVITDRVALPDPKTYTEQPLYLPGSFFPGLAAGAPPASVERASVGLPPEGVVYAAFHTPNKINPPFFRSWLRILTAVPGAVLWLRDGPAEFRNNLKGVAVSEGVAPARLVFAGRTLTVPEYRARFALADVHLDTAPYNGHTTTADALGVGVPVLTVSGRSVAARIATSLLTSAGFADLAFAGLADYESFAIALGQSPERLAALKARVRAAGRASPLFDMRRYCALLETGFEMIVARAEAGLPPAPVEVGSDVVSDRRPDAAPR